MPGHSLEVTTITTHGSQLQTAYLTQLLKTTASKEP
jgi:hypothetical protein